jgi:hypothetical protein
MSEELPPIAYDPDDARRRQRLIQVNRVFGAREFVKRIDGMMHVMNGGVWLHRHVWLGRKMVHLVSIDRELLAAYGRMLGIDRYHLQFKPLKDPRTGERRDAWHWDLGGPVLPPDDPALRESVTTATERSP